MTGQDSCLYHVFGPSGPTKNMQWKIYQTFWNKWAFIIWSCEYVHMGYYSVSLYLCCRVLYRRKGKGCWGVLLAFHCGTWAFRNISRQKLSLSKCTLHKLIEVGVSILPYNFCVSNFVKVCCGQQDYREEQQHLSVTPLQGSKVMYWNIF